MPRPVSLWGPLTALLGWMFSFAVSVLRSTPDVLDGENRGLFIYWVISIILAMMISLVIGQGVEAVIRRRVLTPLEEVGIWVGLSLIGLVLFAVLIRPLGNGGPWSFFIVIFSGFLAVSSAVTAWTAAIRTAWTDGSWRRGLLLWLPGASAILWAMWKLTGWLGHLLTHG